MLIAELFKTRVKQIPNKSRASSIKGFINGVNVITMLYYTLEESNTVEEK